MSERSNRGELEESKHEQIKKSAGAGEKKEKAKIEESKVSLRIEDSSGS